MPRKKPSAAGPRVIIRKPEVLRRTGYSDTTIWREEKAGRFPQRVQLSPMAVGWYERRHRGVGARARPGRRQATTRAEISPSIVARVIPGGERGSGGACQRRPDGYSRLDSARYPTQATAAMRRQSAVRCQWRADFQPDHRICRSRTGGLLSGDGHGADPPRASRGDR